MWCDDACTCACDSTDWVVDRSQRTRGYDAQRMDGRSNADPLGSSTPHFNIDKTMVAGVAQYVAQAHREPATHGGKNAAAPSSLATMFDAKSIKNSDPRDGRNQGSKNQPTEAQTQVAPAQDRMQGSGAFPWSRKKDAKPPAEEESESKPAAEDGEEKPCCILHGPTVDEDSILKSWWCCYCCCWGLGSLAQTNSPSRCMVKCICVQQVCEMVECETQEGLCGSMQTCCCVTPMIQWPAPEGLPWCMLCSTMIGGLRRSDASKQQQASVEGHNEEDAIMAFENAVFNHHQLCYCCCAGCAVKAFFDALYDAYFKCCCCRYSFQVVPPCEPEGLALFRVLANCGLNVAQCRFPLQLAGNPILALCGKRYRRNTLDPGFRV